MTDWEEWGQRKAGETTQYKLDPVIAQRVKELRLGLNGEMRHSWRALAIKVSGYECQMTGSDLESLAQWTLGENWYGQEMASHNTETNSELSARIKMYAENKDD